MPIALDERLRAAAGLVREGAVLCDVGTDHAYLPCALAAQGRIKKAFAMDVAEGPLANARETVMHNGLQEAVLLRLSDGLDALTEDERQEITDILICGMGGELIDRIICRAPWLKNAKKSLVLQPMTKASFLRRRLYAQGFEIQKEVAVFDHHHCYSVMRVIYAGKAREIDPLFAEVGKLPDEKTEDARRYMRVAAGRLKKAAMGMLRGHAEASRAAALRQVAAQIDALLPDNAVTVGAVFAALDRFAPFASACGWDNSGLQTGSMEQKVSGVVLALDCTAETLAYAGAVGANLVITHHPIIFDPLRQVLSDSVVGMALQGGISVISAHTNLDLAAGGVSDCLAKALDLEVAGSFGEDGVGRIASCKEPLSPAEFAALVKKRLHTAVRYWAGDRKISTVALVGGAGSDEALAACETHADAYLTGELKHNCFIDCAQSGMTFVEAGHYATERVVLPQLSALLAEEFPELPIAVYELTRLASI